ncbi:hypothetical protein L484_009852 [Morus notabilis]|uniref:Uncharacterized protein n=1 Tax=Morus notabilis TaxID=981085 RepID=W9RJ90_9ROSA|nr:hypothetical protein L484_009852 [Morus notabilis]
MYTKVSCNSPIQGLGFLAISTPEILSSSCREYKPECVGTGNKMLFFIALVLIVIGKSGYTTSLEDLITEQTRGLISKVKLFLLSIHVLVIVHLIGVIAIPHILKRWSTRFGVPALCMAVATSIFLTGFGHTVVTQRIQAS